MLSPAYKDARPAAADAAAAGERRLLLGRWLAAAALVAATGTLTCRTGRSQVGMNDDLSRLENELATLNAQYDASVRDRAALESEFARMQALYEETRRALARRDQLRGEVEAAGYAPATAEAYATVGDSGGGQVRREVGATTPAAPGNGERSGPSGAENNRATGRYRGRYKVHVVAAGEYLYKIAGYRRYYGDPERWEVIYDANAYQIKNPHWIFVGQRLRIPVL